jgi:DNA-binding MarR family transcriptional regulator
MSESKIELFIPRNSVSKGKLGKGLGMLSFLVYHGLKQNADNTGHIQISYRELSELLGVGKSSSQKAVEQLIKAKLIKRLKPASRTAIPIYLILKYR